MAVMVTRWKSDNGTVYDTELEAVKADALYWKAQAAKDKALLQHYNTKRIYDDDKDYVRCGGGMSNNHP